MRRILTTIATASAGAAGALWFALIRLAPAGIASLSEFAATGLYTLALVAILCGGVALAAADRSPIQFFGGLATVVAFLGLAALHTSYTRSRRGDPRPPPPSLAVEKGAAMPLGDLCP